MKKTLILAAAIAVVGFGTGLAVAGEYHVANDLICYDCHTPHFSMQHGWDGSSAISTTPAPGGNWLGTSGPNEYLLKAPVNLICQECHDGQTGQPDVVAQDTNATSTTQGREAGALNDTAGAAPYETWKGHTLDSTDAPPGYNPTLVGANDSYDPTNGLECVNCHLNHGIDYAYRNLGPRSMGGSDFRPTYQIGTAQPAPAACDNGAPVDCDVWINIASGYVPGTGNAATFGPYYDTANINFLRSDATLGSSVLTSNKIGNLCAGCHADFHGGPGDANIGGSGSPPEHFERHPTAQVNIGDIGGGHSRLTYLQGATSPVKVATNDYSGQYANSSPICVSCHKGHGNQNPFGLLFLHVNASAVTEEGGFATGQTSDTPTGLRNLCGQCHVQGNH